MAYEVEWSKVAISDLERVVEYLRDEWSIEVAVKFVEKVDAMLELLMNSPYLGKVSKRRKNVRQVLITRHNRLFYRVTGNKIELLKLFDTRQNPKKSIY